MKNEILLSGVIFLHEAVQIKALQSRKRTPNRRCHNSSTNYPLVCRGLEIIFYAVNFININVPDCPEEICWISFRPRFIATNMVCVWSDLRLPFSELCCKFIPKRDAKLSLPCTPVYVRHSPHIIRTRIKINWERPWNCLTLDVTTLDGLDLTFTKSSKKILEMHVQLKLEKTQNRKSKNEKSRCSLVKEFLIFRNFSFVFFPTVIGHEFRGFFARFMLCHTLDLEPYCLFSDRQFSWKLRQRLTSQSFKNWRPSAVLSESGGFRLAIKDCVIDNPQLHDFSKTPNNIQKLIQVWQI